jgi:hypothetical protein
MGVLKQRVIKEIPAEMVVADGTLTPFAEGVWVDTEPVRFLGLRLMATMAVLRLGDESLLLYSPVAMTPERRVAVEELGPVAHLYAPNLFHHLWIGEWAAAFPSARLHAPGDLAEKCRDLRIDRVHGAPEPAFAGVVDEVRIEGFRLKESVLVYGPAHTLVVADPRTQHRSAAASLDDALRSDDGILRPRRREPHDPLDGLLRSGRRTPQPRRSAGASV